MIIYDEVMKQELAMLAPFSGKRFKSEEIMPWEDGGNNDMVFASDCAYELGAGTMAAVSEQMMTSDESMVPEDEVLLIGPDICDIKGAAPYAKIALLRVSDEGLEGEGMYDRIRGIQYTKYRVHPKGFMTRVSSTQRREPARVSKKAVSDGLSFAAIGKNYIDQYRIFPQVKAVKMIFITDPDFDYKALTEMAEKAENITAALDHVLRDYATECDTCSLKTVCDEVEGMRELHFSQAGK